MTAKKRKPAAKKAAEAGKDPRGGDAKASAAKQNAAPAAASARRDAAARKDAATAAQRRRLQGGDDLDPAYVASAAGAKKEKRVTVRVPRAFKLLVVQDGQPVVHSYESGIGEMPLSHALHDYAVANGVEVVAE